MAMLNTHRVIILSAIDNGLKIF